MYLYDGTYIYIYAYSFLRRADAAQPGRRANRERAAHPGGGVPYRRTRTHTQKHMYIYMYVCIYIYVCVCVCI